MRGLRGVASLCVRACVCARASIGILTPTRNLAHLCISAGTASSTGAASRQEFQISAQKLQATSSASAERKSPLFKDSWLLQEHILFQMAVFGQFTLFIRFEINGSQSRRKVNKRLQKVLSHATRLARLRHLGPLVCEERVKEAQRRFSQGLSKN